MRKVKSTKPNPPPVNTHPLADIRNAERKSRREISLAQYEAHRAQKAADDALQEKKRTEQRRTSDRKVAKKAGAAKQLSSQLETTQVLSAALEQQLVEARNRLHLQQETLRERGDSISILEREMAAVTNCAAIAKTEVAELRAQIDESNRAQGSKVAALQERSVELTNLKKALGAQKPRPMRQKVQTEEELALAAKRPRDLSPTTKMQSARRSCVSSVLNKENGPYQQ